MSMPPAGVVGGTDEDAVIQAEIEWELEHINLDDGQNDLGEMVNDDDEEEENPVLEEAVPDELENYIKRLQEQTSNFERELEECDELITHTDRPRDKGSSGALIPYEDFNLLSELAKQSGCNIDQYKEKILLELEQDEDILHDDLADLIEEDTSVLNSRDPNEGQGQQKVEDRLAEGDTGVISAQETKDLPKSEEKLATDIETAMEQGVDPVEAPVCQDLVPIDSRVGIQQMLRDQLTKLENTYKERTERIKREEAHKRNEEEVKQRRTEEERQWKKQEREREEQKLKEKREAAERQIKEEEEEAMRQMVEQMREFKEEMRVLEAETERQKAKLAQARIDEEIRQLERHNKSALVIQRTYRGYRTRKQYLPVLEGKGEERRKLKEEQRIKEVEKEIEERERQKKEEEEQKRLKTEEEKRQKEEEKRRKEEEKRLREEEKRRKKEEEERKKLEEKRRKEDVKQRLEEEKRQKKEDEKRRKEEEAERKREEKRQREEEEKRRKEEDKRKKEEEKRKKEEEKRKSEEEKKLLEQERKTNEAKRQSLEVKSFEEEKKLKDKGTDKVSEQETPREDGKQIQVVEKLQTKQDSEESENSSVKLTNGYHLDDNIKHDKKGVIEEKGKQKEVIESMPKPGHVDQINKDLKENNKKFGSVEKKLEKKVLTPRTPHPPTSPRKKQSDLKDVQKSIKKDTENSAPVDCLPEPLEARRIAFIKESLPWSKISSEPWKLKGVTSRKPLRRPSSAKKLSPLTEDIILQAARVASLKQVTTVELCDLPGYSMSPLGQCWGLKYLSMTRCNLRLLEGVQQCKQLLYINVQDNKLEYIDLKDVGSLQVLDMSHNCLSSIHGLDNCTNLRWLDISHNNITRLGGVETLRRLHTLKLSHNQLISTASLGDIPTIQVLDVSSNHLPDVEDLEKLCLLLSLDVSSNNILKVPELKNQVLLHELLLTDNSITSLDELSKSWLPLLYRVVVSQNSIVEPENLRNCLTLRVLDISNNQLVDGDILKKCIENCLYLEELNLEENPLLEEVDSSFYAELHKILLRLKSYQPASSNKQGSVKPRCSFEAMCLSQAQVYKDLFIQLKQQKSLWKESSGDLAHKCDSYFKFCDKTFQIAVEHRYAHEYGEVSVTIPTAPITPRSGRPNSGRKIVQKGDTFASPKDLFEKALNSSDKTFVVKDPCLVSAESGVVKTNTVMTAAYSNPKDLFEQALKSGSPNTNSSKCVTSLAGQNHDRIPDNSKVVVNGVSPVNTTKKSADSRTLAAITIQAAWRGWLVRHDISQQTKIWLAAIAIQTAWRGYSVRKWYRALLKERRRIQNIDPELVEKLHQAATKIQAAWRGYWLRSKLLAALEYARFEDSDDDDEGGMNLNGEEFDLDKFMDFKEELLDNDWRPPSTPEIPANHPVLRKPPSGRPKIPPISTGDRPPSNPRRAWKNLESPMSDIQNPLGRIPRPPSSVSSGADTHRTVMSKKEEKLSEEWGFKDTSTAHLMIQRAKKMKYNAERKKKISKLDPKQRLRLFRKLQEVAHIDQPVHVTQRKTLPRKEYFKARQDEIVRKQQEKQEEYNTRASRIYEWLHMPVNNYPVTDSIINQGLNHRIASENNLPDVQAGRRVQLTSGPGSLELQSVDSASIAGEQRRRFSAGSGSSFTSKLPPIQSSSSAPTAKVKEKMSWRSTKVNQSVGWGGGKKRGERH